MTKNSKRRLLLMTVFLSVLLSCGAYASLIPNAHAAELTTQQKGLAILRNVVGLNLTKYSVTTKEIPADQQASYFGVVPQENVGYDLISGESRLKTLYTFVRGKLQMIHVLETEGTPNLIKPATIANPVEMAKDFLGNYQAYTAYSIYEELKSTLDSVDASKNATKLSGNTQLDVSAIDGYTTFRWTYTFNGVIAPSKVVALGFKNGFLKYFVDNWNLYGVGSTNINLSKKEAIAIALETAKAYNWSVKLDADTLETKNFNESNVRWASLLFDDSLGAGKARSEDILTVYPVWRVGVALSKWYGNMYGIEVDVWADAKEVRRVQEAWSTLPPPEGVPTADGSTATASANSMWIALPAIAATTAGTALVWASRKKKLHPYRLLGPRGLKTGGILFCVLIASMILMSPIATVNATSRAAVIWGSESTGAGAYPYSSRKSPTEIDLQRQVASDIRTYFAVGGYTGINHQGNTGSSKSQILNDISYYQSNYNYVAVVDFDHGIGRTDYLPQDWGYPYNQEFHYMFEDNVGTWHDDGWHAENGVYDTDIYPLITPGKINLAFISTCLSANLTSQTGNPAIGQGDLPPNWPPVPGRYEGMPYAWTHRIVEDKSTPGFNIAQHISIDGYNNPDCGPQVYIGWPWGAASLEQTIPFYGGTKQYEWWVGYFFYYALEWDMSVNQALDQASLSTWPGEDFGASDLKNGFQAHWW